MEISGDLGLPVSPVPNQERSTSHAEHSIGAGARIGPTLVLDVNHFVLGAGAVINFGNVFREMELVTLGEQALIGQWNWFTSARALAVKWDPAAERSSLVTMHR